MSSNRFKNIWVNLISRDYDQVKQDIVDAIKNPLTGIPEITDHSESNDFIILSNVWAGISSMLGYYIDDKGRESFLPTLRRYESAVLLADQWDYRIRGWIASTGEITITLSDPTPSDINIPENFKVSNSDGVIFSTIEPAIIATGQDTVTIPVRQRYSLTGTTDQHPGTKDWSYEFSDLQVEDFTLQVWSGTNTFYSPVESFFESNSTSLHFKPVMNVDGNYSIKFGDGINGILPTATTVFNYIVNITQGSDGNLAAGEITEFVDSLTLPSGITAEVINNDATTNGKDPETVSDLQKYIPLARRTKYRAVTEQDYIDVAELTPGVEKAGYDFDCGKTVDLYILPAGGGIASSVLRQDCFDYVSDKDIAGMGLRVFSAGLVLFEVEMNINALPNFFNSQVKSTSEQVLLDFFDITNQEISGEVRISDIYEKIEIAENGVKYSNLIKLKPIPYARPLDDDLDALDWSRSLNQNSTLQVYRINFTSNTTFKLTRGSTFINTFNVGVQIVTPDITFTVNAGSYQADDKYEFVTYPFEKDDVVLSETSIPATDISLITLNVTGGL